VKVGANLPSPVPLSNPAKYAKINALYFLALLAPLTGLYTRSKPITHFSKHKKSKMIALRKGGGSWL
jgi:hypothetical protein